MREHTNAIPQVNRWAISMGVPMGGGGVTLPMGGYIKQMSANTEVTLLTAHIPPTSPLPPHRTPLLLFTQPPLFLFPTLPSSSSSTSPPPLPPPSPPPLPHPPLLLFPHPPLLLFLNLPSSSTSLLFPHPPLLPRSLKAQLPIPLALRVSFNP